MSKELIQKIKTFPKAPGVYQFADSTGGILYVGKAKNLKSRIKSYFLKEIGRGPGIDIMVSSATEVGYVETESEIEAILLEAELIKKLKPKYNIRLRDDKSFLVIKIAKPVRVVPVVVIIPAKAGDARRGTGIQETIGIDSPMESAHSGLIRSVRTGSQAAVRNDRLKSGNDISLFPCVELVRYKNVDFSDKSAEYFGPYPSGLLLKKSINYLRKIFPFRDCSKAKYATYRKKGRPCIYGDIRVCTAPCVDRVDGKRYYKNILYLKKFLRGEKDMVRKGLEKEMGGLSKKKRFEEAALIRNQIGALDHLREVSIGLRDDVFDATGSIFHRIECYDISNIGSQYVVGSMVVFTDGKKDTDEYRRFKIRSQITNIKYQPEQPKGDLDRLKQVLERRFKNDWTLPDLIVIDGGEMQLRVAREALKEFVLKIPVVSIAKGPKRDKNEFHYSDSNIAKYCFNNKNLENVVISSRDEAHRFAIAYYRELHKKGMFK